MRNRPSSDKPNNGLRPVPPVTLRVEASHNRDEPAWEMLPFFPGDSWRRMTQALDLSLRDIEIACGILRDESERAMAQRLDVTSRAVHESLARLYKKLQVHSRVQVVVRLAEEHISNELRAGETPKFSHPADGDHQYPLFLEEAWREVAGSLRLSRRQLQVACGVFRDELERKVARQLGISERTVHKHMQKLCEKLGVRSRIRLVTSLLQAHLVHHSQGVVREGTRAAEPVAAANPLDNVPPTKSPPHT